VVPNFPYTSVAVIVTVVDDKRLVGRPVRAPVVELRMSPYGVTSIDDVYVIGVPDAAEVAVNVMGVV